MIRVRRVRHRRRGAALVSAVVILIVVAAFSAVFLSVHSTQVTTIGDCVGRLRAQAASNAATHLLLWQLRRDPNLQDAVARVVKEGDTSFALPALFNVQGSLADATFTAELWPGPDTVRVRAVGQSNGAFDVRWAQMPIVLPADNNLLAGGDFEDPNNIGILPAWLGAPSLGKWLAGYGISQVEDPPRRGLALPWNVSAEDGNHYAESMRWTNMLAQYVDGSGVDGPLSLKFDYLRNSGRLSVTVRGVDALPPAGALFPGTEEYEQWAEAGTVLYESGNLAQADVWAEQEVTVPTGRGYRYYVVQIEATGGPDNPRIVERAVDNLKLLAE
jgi:hypothetical protein